MLLRGTGTRRGEPGVRLEVMCREADAGHGFLAEVRALIRRHNMFRDKVLSFEGHEFGPGVGPLRFHERPVLARTDVVLEDVDLVAESRSERPGLDNPLLFQVLNEMDGLAGDADVAFLLTTNRVDLLEPALAPRPGRVDLAVEVPLPDAAGRRALPELYGRGLRLTPDEAAEIVANTEGVTASFFAETRPAGRTARRQRRRRGHLRGHLRGHRRSHPPRTD